MPQSKCLRLALVFAFTGAFSFWLPDVAVRAHSGPNLNSRHFWAITILMPLTFLFAYLVARKFAVRRMFRWTGPAMLLGVWLTGGVFMTLAAVVSGSGFLGSGVGLLIVIILSVIPVVTYILAALDGSLFALLEVTLGALLVCGIRASCVLLRSAPDKDGSRSLSKVA